MALMGADGSCGVKTTAERSILYRVSRAQFMPSPLRQCASLRKDGSGYVYFPRGPRACVCEMLIEQGEADALDRIDVLFLAIAPQRASCQGIGFERIANGLLAL